MATVVLERETNNYWNLIKDAGNEVKLALIKRLSDAVMPAVAQNKAKKKYTADDFAGIWSDEEYMDAETMVKSIRDGRHVKSGRNNILLQAMARQKYLLDTCICIYWLRDKFNIKDHVNSVGMENCFISEDSQKQTLF